ncbi:MAG: response regulator, partial [Desulfovibrio sp.]|nr:response regulator [Desulfovibrio sp.]
MSTNILCLDDEPNYLLILEAMLSDAGYSVTALSDPETALAYLDESDVDVIITDMKMPKMTGQDVLEHVKKAHPHIPVMIMTAFGSIEAAVVAMKIGAFDYITKPFSNEELLLSVSKAMK